MVLVIEGWWTVGSGGSRKEPGRSRAAGLAKGYPELPSEKPCLSTDRPLCPHIIGQRRLIGAIFRKGTAIRRSTWTLQAQAICPLHSSVGRQYGFNANSPRPLVSFTPTSKDISYVTNAPESALLADPVVAFRQPVRPRFRPPRCFSETVSTPGNTRRSEHVSRTRAEKERVVATNSKIAIAACAGKSTRTPVTRLTLLRFDV